MSDVVLFEGPVQSYRNALHEDVKLVLVEGSGFTVTRRGRRHHALDGQLLAIHPGEAHSGEPDDPEGRWRIMCVGPAAIAPVVEPSALRFADPVLREDALARQFAEVYQVLAEPGQEGLREAELHQLVAALSVVADRAAPAEEAGADLHAADKARAYLSDHLAANVTLDELAEAVGMEKYRLVRACTARYGIPPHALHLRLRIDRAQELVLADLPLARVANETGFHDQAHFARTFGRVCGMTPSQYRASARDRAGEGPRTKRAVALEG